LDIAAALPPEALDEALAPHFSALRAFVDRRIAELSAEVSASVQLMGMSEEAITARLSEVHAQVARLIAIPASGARNSGLELEAVVQATESAADTILEAAEAIQTWLDGGAQDKESIAALTQRVNDIFQACSFQDLTGQRIRRAIKQLQHVETMLEGLMPGGAPPGEGEAPPQPKLQVLGHEQTVDAAAAAGPDLAQAEIDRLLNG
jgi:chemotaxis protein CheZ